VSSGEAEHSEKKRVVMKMKRFKRSIIGSLLLLVLGSAVCGTGHGAVIENSLVVTDVTPVKFSVVWGTQEPATGWVSVFLEPEGTRPCTEATALSESSEHPPAEGIGVLKVSVIGLKPDTEYFFRTLTTLTKNSAVYESPMTRVKTEKASVIVRNDVLVQKVEIGDAKLAPGMLVIASVESASYPITGWVGDGVPEEWAAIDTNNFYNSQTHVNLELSGGEVLKLKVFGGSMGSLESEETIPEESGGMQQLSRAVSLMGSASPSGTTVKVESGGGGSGGGCFISSIME
jgi:hypothetical protein